jgi:lipopolysaccharide/colanic/teichoic acid biosynthesis glycosyltransferase
MAVAAADLCAPRAPSAWLLRNTGLSRICPRDPPPWERAAKRALDLSVALTCLVVLAPLLLLIALAIKLDSPGPALFRQVRVGRYGRPIEMLKFRTMASDRRVTRNGPPPGLRERRNRHKSQSDPRVTPLGRVLRRTCLDELPQLWNIARGDMSLVGPRPELPSIVATYQPWQHARHVVKPGLTGWWQVNRGGGQLMHESTELDLHYVVHQSFWLDLVILARTVSAVIDGSGVY